MAYGVNGQAMELAASRVTKASNTGQEHALDKNTEEMIAKEKTKNHKFAIQMSTAPSMDTTLSGLAMVLAASLVTKVLNIEQEPV
jgi:hypothetical protein